MRAKNLRFWVLEQGKNLYVEKPLALTKAECLDIKSKIKDGTQVQR